MSDVQERLIEPKRGSLSPSVNSTTVRAIGWIISVLSLAMTSIVLFSFYNSDSNNLLVFVPAIIVSQTIAIIGIATCVFSHFITKIVMVQFSLKTRLASGFLLIGISMILILSLFTRNLICITIVGCVFLITVASYLIWYITKGITYQTQYIELSHVDVICSKDLSQRECEDSCGAQTEEKEIILNLELPIEVAKFTIMDEE